MKKAFLNVNNVSTKVLAWGHWVEDTPKEPIKTLILCIIGNPGLCEFYTSFCTYLHEQTGLPIYTLSHAGHDDPQTRDNIQIPTLEGHEDLYTTHGQIEHKIAFIKKYISPETKIYVIGHSIGSYITLQLLKDPAIGKQIIKSYMLFPTVERMVESPNGKFLWNIVRHISFLLIYLAWIFTFLPKQAQHLLLRGYFALRGWPQTEIPHARSLIYPPSLEKILFMGFDEMKVVRDLDVDIMKDNAKKIKMYYGSVDNWAPAHYCDTLKARLPEIDAQICKRGFLHAFMMNDKNGMAKLVAEWIQEES